MDKTKKQIQQILGLSPGAYQERVFNTWVDWCFTKAVNHRSLQKAMLSKPLQNWWLRELEHLERQFLTDVRDFKLSPDAALKAYNFTLRKLYARFSKPLLKRAGYGG